MNSVSGPKDSNIKLRIWPKRLKKQIRIWPESPMTLIFGLEYPNHTNPYLVRQPTNQNPSVVRQGQTTRMRIWAERPNNTFPYLFQDSPTNKSFLIREALQLKFVSGLRGAKNTFYIWASRPNQNKSNGQDKTLAKSCSRMSKTKLSPKYELHGWRGKVLGRCGEAGWRGNK